MMHQPAISVITPVYNGRKHVARCVQNIIDQNCPVAEHIIVDGASSDGSVEIIRQLAKRHTHIRWISEPDMGQSDALNKGTALARGEIIGVLNVDDIYEPGVLDRVLELTRSLKKPWLLVGACNVWGQGNRLCYVNRPRHLTLFSFLLGRQHPVNPSAYFYHRSLHERLGGYDIKEHYAMDIHFLYQAVQIAEARYVDEVWGNFFELPGTKTYEDKKGKSSSSRTRPIVESYRSALPVSQQLLLRLLRPPYILARRAKNALRDPNQVYRRYVGRLKSDV